MEVLGSLLKTDVVIKNICEQQVLNIRLTLKCSGALRMRHLNVLDLLSLNFMFSLISGADKQCDTASESPGFSAN